MSDPEKCSNRQTLTKTSYSGQVILREQDGKTDLLHTNSRSKSTQTILCQALATLAPDRPTCKALHLGDETCPIALFHRGEGSEEEAAEFLLSK